MSEFISRAIRTGGLRRAAPAAIVLLAIFLPLISGCGGGGDDESVLATVGDRKITEDYYKDRLARLTQVDLPKGEDGETLDPTSLAGKRAFLDVIINKELMVLKAHDLGYDEVKEYINGRRALIQIMAGEVMAKDLIEVTPDEVTDADIEAYYAKRQTKRHFQFIICNFEDDALEARQKILDGELWEDVAREYNDGSPGPKGDYTMSVQFGMVQDIFEQGLFSLEIGELSMPLDTVYGYWIVRLTNIEDIRERPLDDTYREQIRNVIAQRRSKLAERALYDASMAKHDYFMDEAALWIVFQGLPEREDYLDPATNQPVAKEDLAPLDVPAEDSDRVFFSCRFDLDADPDVWTIGRYKAKYAEMSVFQRPKRNKMLGGVRQQIMNDMIVKPLQISEARERGYLEDPRVIAQAEARLEQMMVERLHADVVKYDEHVSAAEVEAFWAEHHDEYMTFEQREAHLLVCKEEAAAAAAREALLNGDSWDTVYERFATGKDPVGKGALTVGFDTRGPEREAIFAVDAVGGVTEVFRNTKGWSVMTLDRIVAPVPREKADCVQEIAQRIKLIRKDEALQALLSEWRGDYPVEIDETKLAAMPSWDELQTEQ